MNTKLAFLSKNERVGLWRVSEKFVRPSITYYDDSSCWCFEVTAFYRNLYIRVDRRAR